ncbi:MAG: deoxyribonuclease IV [Nitrospirae bacterium]|nr:deoxyribonuclease IV [Nitrospirota bacterium]
MLIGFHTSIAGGLPLAVKRAVEVGCTTMQIFSHSPRSWKLDDIPREQAEAFIKARAEAGISPLFVHTSYLINLASADDALYMRSIDALRTEMQRADQIGAEYVVTHLGSASSSEPDRARERVADALVRTLDGLNVKTDLLLENTAGERGDVGHRFDDIAWIIERTGISSLGVTVDTCHSFGAGYDFRTRKGIDATIKAIEGSFGFERVKLIHLNDSKHPLGSNRDRHENIGEGLLGLPAFRLILNHHKLRDLPFIMETPKASPEDDARNMAVVRRLVNKTRE